MKLAGDALIGGEWHEGEGATLVSLDPATQQPIYTLREASASQVLASVDSAREALPAWSARPLEDRVTVLRRYTSEVEANAESLSRALASETGKPIWEARTEINAVVAKLDVSIEMLETRRPETRAELGGAIARVRHRPVGVLGVLGPFNLPAHLVNGHVVPALLAGNTVVVKASEETPGIIAKLIEYLDSAIQSPGVVNLVQGGRAIGESLVGAQEVDGILFTGSYRGGQAIARALATRPETQLALEMGGNNPLVVARIRDLDAAVAHTLLSAYITAGQRCTCARRLIVVEGEESERFLAKLVQGIAALRVGLPSDVPEPFMGPMISAGAAEALEDGYRELLDAGAHPLVPLRRDDRSPALVHPALVDVTGLSGRPDTEHFGPLLQVVRVADFDAAIAEANDTAYGLAAGLLSDESALFERFVSKVRAGIVNWNRQTTGASGRLPFGGVGKSGNHRPAGAWAADYCSDPVASLEAEELEAPASLPPGFGAGKS